MGTMAKTKKPRLAAPNARTVFNFAEAFSNAASLLAPMFRQAAIPLTAGHIPPKGWGTHIDDSAMTVPLMVNDSFSLELYLKCLHIMDYNVSPKGHDTYTLFRNLRLRTRQRIRKNYAKELEKASPQLSTMPKRKRSYFTNLRAYMKGSSRTFEQVRYLFERSTLEKPPGLRYWPQFRLAVRQSILDVMPEWACATLPTSRVH